MTTLITLHTVYIRTKCIIYVNIQKLMEHILLKNIMDAKQETEMVRARLLIMLEETNVQKQPLIYIGEKQKINTNIKVSFI